MMLTLSKISPVPERNFILTLFQQIKDGRKGHEGLLECVDPHLWLHHLEENAPRSTDVYQSRNNLETAEFSGSLFVQQCPATAREGLTGHSVFTIQRTP
jgi:hypothetical protein